MDTWGEEATFVSKFKCATVVVCVHVCVCVCANCQLPRHEGVFCFFMQSVLASNSSLLDCPGISRCKLGVCTIRIWL